MEVRISSTYIKQVLNYIIQNRVQLEYIRDVSLPRSYSMKVWSPYAHDEVDKDQV